MLLSLNCTNPSIEVQLTLSTLQFVCMYLEMLCGLKSICNKKYRINQAWCISFLSKALLIHVYMDSLRITLPRTRDEFVWSEYVVYDEFEIEVMIE